jgi:hypothetical protein
MVLSPVFLMPVTFLQLAIVCSLMIMLMACASLDSPDGDKPNDNCA